MKRLFIIATVLFTGAAIAQSGKTTNVAMSMTGSKIYVNPADGAIKRVIYVKGKDSAQLKPGSQFVFSGLMVVSPDSTLYITEAKP